MVAEGQATAGDDAAHDAAAGLDRAAVVVEHEERLAAPVEPHGAARDGALPAVTRDEPWMPASDDPNPSLTMTVGNRSRMRALQPADIGAPPFDIEYTVETSQRPGLASHASSRGLATASPTIVRTLTPSSSIADHTASGSSEPSISTTF